MRSRKSWTVRGRPACWSSTRLAEPLECELPGMTSVFALPLGFLLDQLLGDPPGWPHPVRWLGRLVSLLENPLRRLLPERLAGILLLLLTTSAACGFAVSLLLLASLIHPLAHLAAATLLIYFGLAARSLARETQAVLDACDKTDWP